VVRLLASQNWTVVLPDPVTKFVPVTVPLKLCPAVGVLGLRVKLLTVGGAAAQFRLLGEFVSSTPLGNFARMVCVKPFLRLDGVV
jgi:hypothetical protein